jgi:hypothetical protein
VSYEAKEEVEGNIEKETEWISGYASGEHR